MREAGLFRRYLLPGLVFQSVVIAGGYGTGRELVEFFLGYGLVRGLLAMCLVSTVIWSLVCAASFELARSTRAYDYQTFFRGLLGRGAPLFEVGYALQLLLVLAVVAAAAGSIGLEVFGIPYTGGVMGIMLAVGLLTFKGTDTIERFLAAWSFVLYALYAVMFIWGLARFGGAVSDSFAAPPVRSGWLVGGVRYAAYNLAVVPAILFCLRGVRTRREAVTAGLLAGPIAMIPAFFFLVVMAGFYPGILDQPVPANTVLEALGSRGFQVAFQLVLFGTLIETGTGMIHAVNERIAETVRSSGRILPAWLRPAAAVLLLLMAALLARFGLIDLIARGYGTLTWYFLLVYVLPVLWWGGRRLLASPGSGA